MDDPRGRRKFSLSLSLSLSVGNFSPHRPLNASPKSLSQPLPSHRASHFRAGSMGAAGTSERIIAWWPLLELLNCCACSSSAGGVRDVCHTQPDDGRTGKALASGLCQPTLSRGPAPLRSPLSKGMRRIYITGGRLTTLANYRRIRSAAGRWRLGEGCARSGLSRASQLEGLRRAGAGKVAAMTDGRRRILAPGGATLKQQCWPQQWSTLSTAGRSATTMAMRASRRTRQDNATLLTPVTGDKHNSAARPAVRPSAGVGVSGQGEHIVIDCFHSIRPVAGRLSAESCRRRSRD